VSLQLVTGKDYLSFSAVKNYANCGEQFRLERIVGIPTAGSWALFGGKVFHTASEYLDRGTHLTIELALEDAWQAEEKDLDLDALRPGGRGKVEDGPWWKSHLSEYLQRYVDFRQSRFAEGWKWLDLGSGTPGIEFGVWGEIGGVKVVGYVDRAMVSPTGQIFLIDLKTGSYKQSREQLDVYAELMRQHYKISPDFGQYYMARKAEITETAAFDQSPTGLAYWWADAAKGISAEVFIPNPNPMCSSCQVQPYCRLKGDPGSIAQFDMKKGK